MKHKHIIACISICIFVLLYGCKTNEFIVGDLVELTQNHQSYLEKTNPKKNFIPYKHHKILTKEYKKKFFSPWNAVKHSVSKKRIAKDIKRFKSKTGYGENKQKLNKKWITKIEKNINLSQYPNYKRKAITISNTNIRLLPTHKPHFSKFSDNSNGFPFDNLQNSTIGANTPIYITHISKDNAWVLVETAFVYGWIPIRDIAYAGPKFVKEFKRHSSLVAATSDDFPVKTVEGTYLYQGNIGMVFPLVKEFKHSYRILTCMANNKRYAYAKTGSISKKNSAKMPLRLNTKNIAFLCNKLIDQPYGWGGLYNNRDCSAMIRDLFTPFSIWLPRNSKSQAKLGGLFFDLASMTDKEKEDFINKNGIPYLTLLWFPGHIMLYIGEEENDSIIFHNIWGIRTKDKQKRHIIGKSVITSLKLGSELKHADKNYNLLNRVSGMTLLVPRYK
ncbi:hypothetical protein DID78_05640 [Candidatus Marinamargulisbacteria bacterium SCGC AG-343-D04]|nr:hypothetical protein DID78_05640 [Candidatus Marinamargulisbacteria bacterium SCGC AG-343-D04]